MDRQSWANSVDPDQRLMNGNLINGNCRTPYISEDFDRQFWVNSVDPDQTPPYIQKMDTVEYGIYPKDWTDSPELTVELDQTPPYI